MLLACPTWRLAQKCAERTTLKSPIPRAQRVADRVHLRLASLPGLDPAPRRSADRRATDRATREGFTLDVTDG